MRFTKLSSNAFRETTPFLGTSYLDGGSNKSTLQAEVLASWNRRRTSDNDTIVENDAAKRSSVDETIETTVNESCGVTSSEYHQQDDDITNEFASSQGNSQVGDILKIFQVNNKNP